MKMISAKEHRVTNRMKGAWTENPLYEIRSIAVPLISGFHPE